MVSVLACASSFFTPAPFPLVCVVSSMPMCHHPHPMCCGVCCVVCGMSHALCVVVGTLQHTALLCSILSALLFLSLSLPPPSPQKNTEVWREEREKGVVGERGRGREEEERCDAKTSGKKGAKREKEITTPGVPRLSPTLVLTRPEEA